MLRTKPEERFLKLTQRFNSRVQFRQDSKFKANKFKKNKNNEVKSNLNPKLGKTPS